MSAPNNGYPPQSPQYYPSRDRPAYQPALYQQPHGGYPYPHQQPSYPQSPSYPQQYNPSGCPLSQSHPYNQNALQHQSLPYQQYPPAQLHQQHPYYQNNGHNQNGQHSRSHSRSHSLSAPLYSQQSVPVTTQLPHPSGAYSHPSDPAYSGPSGSTPTMTSAGPYAQHPSNFAPHHSQNSAAYNNAAAPPYHESLYNQQRSSQPQPSPHHQQNQYTAPLPQHSSNYPPSHGHQHQQSASPHQYPPHSQSQQSQHHPSHHAPPPLPSAHSRIPYSAPSHQTSFSISSFSPTNTSSFDPKSEDAQRQRPSQPWNYDPGQPPLRLHLPQSSSYPQSPSLQSPKKDLQHSAYKQPVKSQSHPHQDPTYQAQPSSPSTSKFAFLPAPFQFNSVSLEPEANRSPEQSQLDRSQNPSLPLPNPAKQEEAEPSPKTVPSNIPEADMARRRAAAAAAEAIAAEANASGPDIKNEGIKDEYIEHADEPDQQDVEMSTVPIVPSPVKTKFPTARIKRIMQADEEVGKVAQQAPIAVGKALELFMIALVTKSATIARERNQKRITTAMMKQVIETDDQWDFLRDISAKVDIEEKPTRAGRAPKHEATDSEEEAEPKKKGRGRKKKTTI